MRILVVEDNPTLREGLCDLLEGAGHTVESVPDGVAGARRGVDPAVDLVVLDLMLPGRDGFSVCEELRRQRSNLPILILTARGSEDDKVRGLGLGADDYLTKPFGARELLARIDALIRRSRALGSDEPPIEIDGCVIDLARYQACREGAEIPLTRKEAMILGVLYRHRTRVVRRDELLEQVWQSRGDLHTRTVDMTIANLRQKIERDPARPVIIRTVRGVGYAWAPEEA